MLRKTLALVLTVMVASLSLTAFAAEEKEDKLGKALEKYETTGKIENCVTLSRVESTKVIDDYNILFIMHGNKAYLNTLPHRCSRLGFEQAFSYTVHTGQLCNVDLITVFDSTGNMSGPTCGLGKFKEYKEKAKEDKKE